MAWLSVSVKLTDKRGEMTISRDETVSAESIRDAIETVYSKTVAVWELQPSKPAVHRVVIFLNETDPPRD